MLFDVIATVDCPATDSIRRHMPPKSVLKDLVVTERKDHAPDDWGVWDKAKHLKFCGLLTRTQFETLLNEWGLSYDGEGSSLGFNGMQPALVFTWGGDHVIQDVYATPVVQAVGGEPRCHCTERDWHRVKRAVVHHYSRY